MMPMFYIMCTFVVFVCIMVRTPVFIRLSEHIMDIWTSFCMNLLFGI